MAWGDNGAARPTTEAYRESKYWDSVEKAKKEKKDKEECENKTSKKS